MMKFWRAPGLSLFLIALLIATLAWAETVEFVTYYPSPVVGAGAGSNMEAMAIGGGYEGVTPDDGELLVFERLGIGPGFDVAQPISRLHVVGGANQNNSAIFMPGNNGQMRMGIGTANPQPIPGGGNSGLEVRTDITVSGPNNANVSSINWAQDNNGPWWHFSLRNSGNLEMYARAAANQAAPTIPLAMTVTGNVGIGTTTPMSNIGNGTLNTSLDVNGWILSRSNGANTWGDPSSRIGVVSGNNQLNAWWISANPNNTFGIHQGGVGDRLTILQNGNVGINITNPGQRLHVYEPNSNVWAANIQGNTHGLHASGSTHGVYGTSSGGGWGLYGYNGSYGSWGGFGYSNIGMYCGSPQANWASIASGSYYGSYAYGGYYGMYAQNGTYWYPALFAYNSGSGYYSYIAHGYYGLVTNGYISGYWASSADFKKNVVPLTPQDEVSILSKIERMPVVLYQYKMDADERYPRLGTLAESAPKEITNEDGKGLEPAAYSTLTLAGVKALSSKLKLQQETIERQQAELDELKRRLSELDKEKDS